MKLAKRNPKKKLGEESSKKSAATAKTILTIIKRNAGNRLYNSIINVIYLKNESTNSYLLNTCKSSIPSPTPIYFTGI